MYIDLGTLAQHKQGGSMKFMFFIALIVVIGCSSQRNNFDQSVPYPVKMALFPALAEAPKKDFSLTVLFYLNQDGNVLDVALAGDGISPEWDAAAIDSMRKWVFSKPSQIDNQEGIWVRRTVKVQFEDTVIMNLVSVSIPNESVADSVYATLTYRSKLEELFEDPTKHAFPYTYSAVYDQNLGVYPDHVRNELKKLRIFNYTKPIKLDSYYVIYQRLDTLNYTIQ
jgi:hypothetical protein